MPQSWEKYPAMELYIHWSRSCFVLNILQGAPARMDKAAFKLARQGRHGKSNKNKAWERIK
jgi:hypothetical protein